MLIVTYNPSMVSDIMLSVVMLSVACTCVTYKL